MSNKSFTAGPGPRLLLCVVLLGTSVVALVGSDAAPNPPVITVEMLETLKVLPGGLAALPSVPVPPDNPQTDAKVQLGKHLFFDKRLSLDRSLSCSSCHDPAKAFTDGRTKASGFGGFTLSRNAPTVLNAAFNRAQFWDGRARSLEEQAKGPLTAKHEMNMLDEHLLVARLNHVPEYKKQFQTAFGSAPSLDNVARAIAAFERTLTTPDSRFDRYANGDKSSLTVHEKQGLILFFGKAACAECHNGPNFTDDKLYGLGTSSAANKSADMGRFAVTRLRQDKGVFKTPTLRNIELTGPYMHDGSFATLEEVVELYNRGGDPGPNKSKLLHKLDLSSQEKSDLIAFLKTLTGTMPAVEKPEMYPDAPLAVNRRLPQ